MKNSYLLDLNRIEVVAIGVLAAITVATTLNIASTTTLNSVANDECVEAASASSVQADDYRVSNHAVCWNTMRVAGADRRTFRALGFGYAKDRWHAYFAGAVIPGVDAASFVIPDQDAFASYFFAKDNAHVYMSTDDPAPNHVLALPDRDPRTFTPIGGGVFSPDYQRDARGIYCYGAELEGADVESFRLVPLGGEVDASDASRNYWRCQPVEGGNAP